MTQRPEPAEKPYSGVWVLLEGPDGCGTSTQVPLLNIRIKKLDKGHKIFETQEPTTEDFGKYIRLMFKDPSLDHKRSGALMTELFSLNREYHMEYDVEPALNRGTIVLQDRGMLSTLAYQSYQGQSYESILARHEFLSFTPDLILIFDIGYEAASKRMGDKSHQEAFDRWGDMQKALRSKYQEIGKIMSERGHNVHFVDANLGIKELTDECWRLIEPLLPRSYHRLTEIAKLLQK